MSGQRPEDETVSWDAGGVRSAPAPVSSALAVGEVLEERYQVVRFIAAGGAGEVYEAQDLELDQRIALKTIRRSRAAEADVTERLKREIQLARQVTHPNVCRLYELGHHRLADGRQLLFLTMELLEGESLWDLLQRLGPMTTEDALPLVRQMAVGLEAAHRAGVVHRDLKSSNVMLVPPREGSGLRAVITDFGLARSVDDLPDKRLTSHDMRLGTPAYMAPEQVQGLDVTAAADIYAFGIVLFEMLTGHLPFEGNALAGAYQRLTQPPSSPRIYVPDLDKRWEQAILRCLERHPERRFASASEVVRAIEVGSGGARGALRRHARWLIAALVLGGLAVLGGGSLWRSGNGWSSPFSSTSGSTSSSASGSTSGSTSDSIAGLASSGAGSSLPTSPVARRSVAILTLHDLAGAEDTQWLGPALAEMLTTEAAAGDRLRVVAGEEVARVRLELELDRQPLDSPMLQRVGRLLGCELVVDGSYLVTGERPSRQIRLDVVARSTRDGREALRVKERGSEDALLDLVEKIGRSLRATLDLDALTDAEAAGKRAALPAGEAARFYAEGVELLRRDEAQRARELLERAVAADPGHPLPRAALAAALSSLGYRQQAREEAARAASRANVLPRREAMWVEAQTLETEGRNHEALALYASLWAYFPDEKDYGLRVAKLQARTGDATKAQETVAELRAVTGDGGPELDLVAAEVARALADYGLQQQLAARAAEAAESLGAGLLAARAREVEAGAWRDLGDHGRALAAYDAALKVYERAHLEGPRARILASAAIVHRHQGRLEEASRLAAEAIEISNRLGDVGTRRFALNTQAIILRQQGQLRAALHLHELELEANRQVGEERSVGISLTSLGVVERRLGRLDAAEAHFEESLEQARSSANRRSESINLNLLGEIDLRRGRLEAARRRFQEALDVNQETRDPRGRAYYLSALGEVAHLAGELEDARGKYEEALRVRVAVGEKDNAARSRLALASLALDEGQADAAARLAAEVAADFKAQESRGDEALAVALAARAHSSLGDSVAAGLAARAQQLASGLEDREVVARIALMSAAVDRDAAGAQKVAREASSLGFVDLEIEALLLAALLAEDPGGWRAAAANARELGLYVLPRRYPWIEDGI